MTVVTPRVFVAQQLVPVTQIAFGEGFLLPNAGNANEKPRYLIYIYTGGPGGALFVDVEAGNSIPSLPPDTMVVRTTGVVIAQ